MWQIKHSCLVCWESVKSGIPNPFSPDQTSNSCPVAFVIGSNGLLSLSKKWSMGRTRIQLVVFLSRASRQKVLTCSATLLNKKKHKITSQYKCLSIIQFNKTTKNLHAKL